MNSSISDLDKIVADYLIAVETGDATDLDTLCDRHPEHADSIRDYFAVRANILKVIGTEDSAAAIQIEGYDILREIGRGAMGVVFEAIQKNLHRQVAIKVLKEGALGSAATKKRFEDEAKLIAQLDHEHVVGVIDSGVVNGQPYMVMPLIHGKALNKVIQKGPLPHSDVVRLMLQATSAISEAHEQGIVHRDIKPANILADSDLTSCRIADFGLAAWSEQTQRLTQTGDIVGTAGYIAPEVIKGKSKGDTKSDTYSIGATIYALLTGVPPFRAATPAESILLAMNSDPVPPRNLNPGIPVDLESICLKCMHPVPDRRYSSAQEIHTDLQQFVDGKPVIARPVSSWETLNRWAKRNRGLAASIVTIAAVLLAGIGGTTWFALESRAETARAKKAEAVSERNSEQSKLDKLAAEKSAKRTKDAFKIFTDSFRSVDPNEGADADMLAKDVLIHAKDRLENSELDDEGKAEMLSALTSSFLGVGAYEPAVLTAEAELALRKTLLGIDHTETLEAMNRLARSYQNAGHFEKAIKFDKDLLKLLTTKLGDVHSSTLTTMGNLAASYRMAGKNDKALELLQQVVELRKTELGIDHPSTLNAMGNLAASHRLAGENDKSLILCQQVLELQKTKLGLDHTDTLTTLGNLAASYRDAGEIDLAIEVSQQLLGLQKTKLGHDHPKTLVTMGNLAISYSAAGNLTQSMAMYQQVLELMKTKLGSNHPDTLRAMANVAGGYRASGELDKALELDKQVLDLLKTKLGSDHPDTLASMANLVVSYGQAGKANIALELSQQVLELKKNRFGADHPSTMFSMASLAVNYERAGETDKALELNQQVLELRKTKLGPDHLETLRAMANLAVSYHHAGESDKARELDENVLELRRIKLGANHPDTLKSMANLATSYFQTGAFGKALALFEEVLELQKTKFGFDHPETMSTMSNLAVIYLRQGETDKGLELSRQALELRKIKLGVDHPKVLVSMNNLAGGYYQAGENDKAVKLFEQLLKLLKTNLSPDHANTVNVMSNLARCYRRAGEYAKSIELYQQVLEQRKTKHGLAHPSTLISMDNLASSYYQAGQNGEALELFQQVLKLRKTKLGSDHPDTLNSMASLAVSQKDSGLVEEAIRLLEEVFERSENKETLQRYVPHLREAYIKGKQIEKLKMLLQNQITEARDASNQIELRKELGRSGDALLQVEAYADAEVLLREYHELFLQEDAGSWQEFNARSLLGAALSKLEKNTEAKPLLTEAFTGLNDNAEQIPKNVREKHLSRSAQWLIELAETTANEEDLKKWTAEKERIMKEHGSDEKSKTDSD